MICTSRRRGIRRICSYVTFQVFTCWRSWFYEMFSCCVMELRESNFMKNRNSFIFQGVESPLKLKAVLFFYQTHCVVQHPRRPESAPVITGFWSVKWWAMGKKPGFQFPAGNCASPIAVSRPVLAPPSLLMSKASIRCKVARAWSRLGTRV